MSIFTEMNHIRNSYGASFARGAYTIALNAICHMLHIRPLRGPVYAGFDVTYRCNCKCKYCERWKITGETGEELNTEQALEVIRQLGKMGTWMLGLNGGEPLLRSDLLLLIAEGKKHGMVVDVNTNGFLLKQMAKQLVESRVNAITISIEDTTEEYHDNIRGREGLFNRIVEGIDELLRIRGSLPVPKIKVRALISRENYKNIDGYLNYWGPLVDEVILQPVHSGERNYFRAPESMSFSENDEVEFNAVWEDLRKKHKLLTLKTYREVPTFLFRKPELYRKYDCFAGTFYIQIDPYGNVYSCNDYTFSLGNLKTTCFKDIWKSKQASDIREAIRNRKHGCVCWYNCNGTLNCYLTKTIGVFNKKRT
jgi:radical SAM protein with 4Fe4S-binding SPASM domain